MVMVEGEGGCDLRRSMSRASRGSTNTVGATTHGGADRARLRKEREVVLM